MPSIVIAWGDTAAGAPGRSPGPGHVRQPVTGPARHRLRDLLAAYAPASGHPAALGGGGAARHARHARHVRICASAYTAQMLASEWRETSAAALRAARACPYEALATQGHTLPTADFTATLAVEAAIHYLDMTVALPGAPRPDPASLALVRQVLDQLAGSPLPASWDDVTCALKGTGRQPVTQADQPALGSAAGRLPLFG